MQVDSYVRCNFDDPAAVSFMRRFVCLQKRYKGGTGENPTLVLHTGALLAGEELDIHHGVDWLCHGWICHVYVCSFRNPSKDST